MSTENLGGKCADLNHCSCSRAQSAFLRVMCTACSGESEYGYRSLGVGTDNVTRAQHCRAEFHTASHGWVPVDPADVRKVILEEKPGAQLPIDDPHVKAARARLFGSWEMNWLAFNTAHDVALPNSGYAKIAFLMYPQAESAAGRFDSLDPDNFRYQMTAQELGIF